MEIVYCSLVEAKFGGPSSRELLDLVSVLHPDVLQRTAATNSECDVAQVTGSGHGSERRTLMSGRILSVPSRAL